MADLNGINANGLSGTYTVRNVPVGGSSGQVLTKASATDGDVEWTTPTEITIDSELSSSSTNPVQNQVVKTALNLKANESIVADEYSASSTYDVGDYAVYDHFLYRCTTAITTAETWTVAHWAVVDMADEILNLRYDTTTNGINLWDPNSTYVQENASGATASAYTINSDGSITCVRSQSNGNIFLVDYSRTLEAGIYTITGYAEFTDDGQEVTRYITIRVGRDGVSSRVKIQLTEARDKLPYIDTDQLGGWFKARFEIPTSQPFAFEVMGYNTSNGTVSSTYPLTISNLQIERGLFVTDYTSRSITAYDEQARRTAERLTEITQPLDYVTLDEDDWIVGSIYASNGKNYDSSTQFIRTGMYTPFKAGTTFKVQSGYRARVFRYDTDYNFVEVSDFIYDSYTVPYTAPYRVILGPSPAATAATTMYDKIKIGGELYVNLDDIINNLPDGTDYPYAVSGQKIDLSLQKFTATQASYSLPSTTISENLTARQDFDIYGGVLFQLFSDDYVALVDLETGSVTASYAISCGHGNSCQFSDEFYDSTDDYPLLYCFGYSNNLVYVNRVTDSGATLIRTYKLDTAGYRFSGGLDVKNNQLVTIHFKIDSSTSSSGNGNYITVWDLNDTETDSSDDTLIPTIITQAEIPFFPVVQGCAFFKDVLYVASGYYPTYGYQVKLTGFNKDGNIVTQITDFPTAILQSESEAISFYKTSDRYKCYFATGDLFELNFN